MRISLASTQLLSYQRPRQSAASANKRRINMEPTLTQNCALYYAQHKTSKGRAALFKKFRAAGRKQGRMFGGNRPPATYSSYQDFIGTTGAESLHSLPS